MEKAGTENGIIIWVDRDIYYVFKRWGGSTPFNSYESAKNFINLEFKFINKRAK